jgi:hypothetical protein
MFWRRFLPGRGGPALSLSPGSGVRKVADDHFSTGVWAPTGPLRLSRLTCVECGRRTTTWEAFTAHRRACVGHLPPSPAPATATPPPAPLPVDLAGALRGGRGFGTAVE